MEHALALISKAPRSPHCPRPFVHSITSAMLRLTEFLTQKIRRPYEQGRNESQFVIRTEASNIDSSSNNTSKIIFSDFIFSPTSIRYESEHFIKKVIVRYKNRIKILEVFPSASLCLRCIFDASTCASLAFNMRFDRTSSASKLQNWSDSFLERDFLIWHSMTQAKFDFVTVHALEERYHSLRNGSWEDNKNNE